MKKALALFLVVLLVFSFACCGKDDFTGDSVTTEKNSESTKDEVKILSLNKEYISHYDWHEDYPKMLVQSEYVNITVDKAHKETYPEISKILDELCTLRENSMEAERENLFAFAKESYSDNAKDFRTQVSSYDIHVRRADSVVCSFISDSYADYGNISKFRALHGTNYDTQTGKELALSDVITDMAELPKIVEEEIMSRRWQGEYYSETAIVDYFENTPLDGISWTLDYNGVTFYFNPGDISPVGSGAQSATITFAEHQGLFNEKYTEVPDSYVVALPLMTSFYADLTGDGKCEEIVVSGSYDEDERCYYTLEAYSGDSYYEVDWFAYGLNPYYVKTKDGNSFLCIFSEKSEEEDRNMNLIAFSLENGEIKSIGETEDKLLYKGDNVFALPTAETFKRFIDEIT